MAALATLIGESAAFLDMVEMASRAAALERPVLVIGERGTGKELIAERLHRLSPRWGGPFLTMNCAALPENLLDAELFGHEAGAFTGAQKARAGRFEEADGGTLFLDEIGTLSAAAQERLLRVIEYGELTRLGGNRVIEVDVRVVGATNEDLPVMVEAGRFRADLLDRLSFEVVTLPPLRARREDIAVLARYFASRMAAELGWVRFSGFAPEAMAALEAHDWPGNVRELKNTVERSIYRWGDEEQPVGRIVFDPFDSPWRPRGRVFTRSDAAAPAGPRPVSPVPPSLPDGVQPPDSVRDMRAAVTAYEKAILSAALTRSRYNQREAAAALSMSYDQFRHCLRKHGLL